MACRPRDALQVLGQCVDLLGMLYVARKEDDAANAVVLNEVGDFLGGPGSLESGYEQLTDLLLQAHSNGIAGHNLTFLVRLTSHNYALARGLVHHFFASRSSSALRRN